MRFDRASQVVLLAALLGLGAWSCAEAYDQSTGAGGSDSAATTGAASASGDAATTGAASASGDAATTGAASTSGNAATTGAASASGSTGGSMATGGGMGGSMATGGGMGGSMALGNHLWSKRFGGASTDMGYSVAVDSVGNLIVTGVYANNTVDFGGGGLTNAGSYDVFVGRYDPPGKHLWSEGFGAVDLDLGFSVAFDSVRNVLVTGCFRGTVDFGGGGLTSAGFDDIFVVKYDASGKHLWSKRFGDAKLDTGRSVAFDSVGNVLVTGYFQGPVDFGGGVLTSAGGADIFVAKYDASGKHLWSKRFGGASHDDGRSVAVDSAGNVLVTGHFQGTADFGGGTVTSAGNLDIFVAKYDASGKHLWSKRFGGWSNEEGRSVAVDSVGNVLVTGDFWGPVDFGGGAFTSVGFGDIFVVKYDASGKHLWSHHFGGTGFDDGRSVVVDSAGNVLVAGDFQDTVDFGGGGLASAGGRDIFVAKYDASGSHLWSKRFGDGGNDYGRSVAVDGLDNVFVTGSFLGTADFGGGGLKSAGSADIFVAKFSP